MIKKILNWLATGETGESSKSIAFFMAGQMYNVYPHPYDPADFKRCLKLLIAVPEIRPRLSEMRSIDKYWKALIEHWYELEKCFMEEVPEWLTDNHSKKSAPKTYDLMKKIYSDAENNDKITYNKALCYRLEICADEMDDLKRRPMAATIREAIEVLKEG
jgi:hypothetical protein